MHTLVYSKSRQPHEQRNVQRCQLVSSFNLQILRKYPTIPWSSSCCHANFSFYSSNFNSSKCSSPFTKQLLALTHEFNVARVGNVITKTQRRFITRRILIRAPNFALEPCERNRLIEACFSGDRCSTVRSIDEHPKDLRDTFLRGRGFHHSLRTVERSENI